MEDNLTKQFITGCSILLVPFDGVVKSRARTEAAGNKNRHDISATANPRILMVE
jgi:hypothetical protein